MAFPLPLLSSVWNQKYVNTERPSLSERYCSPLLSFFFVCLCFSSRGAEADGFSKQVCAAHAAKKPKKSVKRLETQISPQLHSCCQHLVISGWDYKTTPSLSDQAKPTCLILCLHVIIRASSCNLRTCTCV